MLILSLKLNPVDKDVLRKVENYEIDISSPIKSGSDQGNAYEFLLQRWISEIGNGIVSINGTTMK